MKKPFKRFFNTILALLIIIVIAVCGGVVYLTVTEYSPETVENVDVFGTPTTEVLPGDKIKVMTYNIGSAVKTAGSDWYEDGGSGVRAESKDSVDETLGAIAKLCTDRKAHVNFFQEADVDARRSYSTDEASFLSGAVPGRASTFAYDFKCTWVPLPLPVGMGGVTSGSLTLTRFGPDSAERVALPEDSGWPSGTWSRKPGLLVSRTKLGDSTKQLVLINLNLSKYDDGSVRKAQYTSLCEFMQMEFAKGNYVIAGGSFNAALPSASAGPDDETDVYTTLPLSTDNLTGGWKYCTDDSTATMRLAEAPLGSEAKTFVTDGFITSPNTIVENTETIDTLFAYSDHNPVVTDVTLVK